MPRLKKGAPPGPTQVVAPVDFPVESFGACRNSRKCRNVAAVLGNGLCVHCYDLRCAPSTPKKTKVKTKVKAKEKVTDEM